MFEYATVQDSVDAIPVALAMLAVGGLCWALVAWLRSLTGTATR